MLTLKNLLQTTQLYGRWYQAIGDVMRTKIPMMIFQGKTSPRTTEKLFFNSRKLMIKVHFGLLPQTNPKSSAVFQAPMLDLNKRGVSAI